MENKNYIPIPNSSSLNNTVTKIFSIPFVISNPTHSSTLLLDKRRSNKPFVITQPTVK
jgi:hypothetical protein